MQRGRLALAVACVCGLALFATGCGSGRSAEAAFRTRANGICRQVERLNRSVDFSSRSGFARGLAGMRAGAERFAHLHPVPREAPAYRDLLAKMRDIDSLLGANEAELLRVQRRLKQLSGRRAMRTIKRFRALVSPIASDGLAAAADARALGLRTCATDLSGGAPLAPSFGIGGRPT